MDSKPEVKYDQLPQDQDPQYQHVFTVDDEHVTRRLYGHTDSQHPGDKHQSLSQSRTGSIAKLQDFIDDAWIVEWLALLISAQSLTAIVLVLHHYNDKKLPHWHSFSLNTLISFLSTVAEACAMYSISTSLGQMKWEWFARASRSLSGLNAFDEAGRGLIGSVQLLFGQRVR
jgi:hypothetical protein